jgi:pimeloyl-ACP methyl ester carboxylesterase
VVSSQRDEVHPFKSAEARERYLAFYADAAARQWPLPSEERTVTTADGETFMRISGPADAPPLVLLPGGRTNSLCWAPIIEPLSQQYRTYALDAIYDDGRSVNATPMKTPDDVAGWLDRLFDALGFDGDVNLMGVSFGAWSSAEYALRHGDRLAKMVWLSPAGTVANISGKFVTFGMLCMIPSERSFGAFTRWIMPYAAKDDPDFVSDAVTEMVVSEKCFKFRNWPGGPRKLTDEELAGLDVPVLYMVGDHERVCAKPLEAVQRVRTVAPQIEVEVFPDAGHDLTWIHTDAVVSRTLAFLGS